MRRSAGALLALASLAACTHAPAAEPYALSKEDVERFDGQVVRFNVPGHSTPVIVGVESCRIERARYDGDRIASWDVIVQVHGGFMEGCLTNELERKNGKLVATICFVTIGAGGGCATGGQYVSRDSVRWTQDGSVVANAPIPNP